jgi:hypothetical protein
VTGVDNTDFVLTTTGVMGASITNISGSATTYLVTVNTGSGNGTIRLDVVDNDSIKDAATNPLGGVGTGNGNFTSGETYTIIKSVDIAGNAGLAAVTLSYTDVTPKSTTSDGSGNYSITVPYGWSGTVTPSRIGFSFTPANRNYSNVFSNQVNQNYIASWVGGIKIDSDQNIVAVGRPHVGSQVMAYDGFSSGSLNAYIPMLFNQAFGGTYNAALYIQNLDSLNTANITIKFYDSSGAETCSQTDSLAALASKGYWLPSISCLPVGWVGGAKVESNRNIVTVGRPHIGSEVLTYNGFDAGTLNAYVPMLFNQAFGGTYNAALYIQNVDPTNTADLTIRFYDSSGNETCSQMDTIAALASKGYWIPSISCLPTGWVGGAKIESNRNVITVGRPHVGSQVTAYQGFSTGSLNAYVPMLFKESFGGLYNAALYIQNVDGSNTANITIKYYDNAGNLSCTMIDTIAPLASVGYWVPSVTCDTGSLPVGWVGGVKVESDSNIVAVGRPHIDAEVLTYNGFAAGSLHVYVPMMFKDAFGGAYNSALYLQNLDPANTAVVTIRLYDANGNLACTTQDTLSALASKGYWVPSLLCPP